MTNAQRKALVDFLFFSQADEQLSKALNKEFCRVPINNERLDDISAVEADVHDEVEKALDTVLKAFDC